ncbi:hypothetical protein GCM10009642_11670 [Nocardiopsis metallicus]
MRIVQASAVPWTAVAVRVGRRVCGAEAGFWCLSPESTRGKRAFGGAGASVGWQAPPVARSRVSAAVPWCARRVLHRFPESLPGAPRSLPPGRENREPFVGKARMLGSLVS